MTYATQPDLVTRFSERELIQLTDRDNVLNAIDAAVLAGALLDADSEIDAYLQPRYTLPLASVPRVLVNIACDITRYRLYDDRSTEQVTRRYEDAIKLLVKIGKGEVGLGLDAVAQPTVVTGGPQATTPNRIFSADRLADYRG